ncbi:MAG: NAD(P)-binding domain-containing protein, partial [Actinomycetes bacterium]
MNQLTFVGGGRMGEALIAGALRGSFVAADISVVEPDDARGQFLTQSYGVEVSADPASIARSSVVVLAVKPQVLMQVCEQLAPHLAPNTLIISIAAGVRTSALEAALPPGIAVVRVMP